MPVDFFGPDVHDRHVVAELAALWLSRIFGRAITAATIRKWASRGKVAPTGREGRAKTYSLKSLFGYAERIYATA